MVKKSKRLRKIYLVRHGKVETGYVSTGNPPLSDEGRLEAEKCAEKLKALKITRVITGGHYRAAETACIICRKLGLGPPYFSEVFTEFGICINKMIYGVRRNYEIMKDEVIEEICKLFFGDGKGNTLIVTSTPELGAVLAAIEGREEITTDWLESLSLKPGAIIELTYKGGKLNAKVL